jgi:hypothetical protein
VKEVFPDAHHIRHFTKGITTLSRLSGTEHSQICCFLLGIIIDIRLPNNMSSSQLLHAVRGLLDFLYLAQYPCHSSETLAVLDEALDIFHDNKEIFVDLGICNSFNLPKLHFALHYTHMIQMYGTTDNYNTEYTEQLHIDLTKDAYRSTNHKNEFAQMTTWLEQREKNFHHEKYIQWRLTGAAHHLHHHPRPPEMSFRHTQTMTKHPSIKAVTLDKIVNEYGATYFHESLTRYIAKATLPVDAAVTFRQLKDQAGDVYLPFQTLPVFHKVKWVSVDVRGLSDPPVTVDSVHARPGRSRPFASDSVSPRFDTAFINDGTGGPLGVKGELPLSSNYQCSTISHICRILNRTSSCCVLNPSPGSLHTLSTNIPPAETSCLHGMVHCLPSTRPQPWLAQSLACHQKWRTISEYHSNQ